ANSQLPTAKVKKRKIRADSRDTRRSLRTLRLCEKKTKQDSRDSQSRYEILTLNLTFFKLRVFGLKRRSKTSKRRSEGRKSGF
ncbi:MAG: hypothetical protein J6V51_05045, partial [Bacteroidales bacterium]|nr:hypothetical protein [Bacteroidales bacterium]